MDTNITNTPSSEPLITASSAAPSECDIIIVNYNAGVFLLDCVLSLRSSSVAKIIVVDNDSSDESLALLEALDEEKLVIIRNGKNLGFSTACNIGTKASSANHLLFLNPDCVVNPGALSKMATVLESSDDIGMVGGFLSNPDGSEQPGGRRFFPTPKLAFMKAFGFYKLATLFPDALSDFSQHNEPLPTAPVSVEAISGACMMVKRDSLDSVGLWDEGYFLHCEDLDWCMRFKQKGLKVMFVPDAKVTHAWGACSSSRPFFVEWHKHCGMLRFYKKFFREKYSGLMWGLVVLGVWARCSAVFGYHGARLLLGKLGVQRG